MEEPEKNQILEYSKYDEPNHELDALDKATEERILTAENQIEQLTVKIEEIKIDPDYSDDERAEAIQSYSRLIEGWKENIRAAKEGLGYSSILKKMDKLLKEQADEILKRGESLDPLTADIENEGKPPRKVN